MQGEGGATRIRALQIRDNSIGADDLNGDDAAQIRAKLGIAWTSGSQVPVVISSSSLEMWSVGTGPDNLLRLDASGKIPAVDGSQITNLPAAGGGLLASSNLSDLSDAAAAREALGLGSAATLLVGTGSNNIVQLDASGRLPALNASLLTNLPGASSLIGTTPYVVGPTGSGAPYTSIQAAVSAAEVASPTYGTPAIVAVLPGIYTENVALASHVSLFGAGGSYETSPRIVGTVTADYGNAQSGPYQAEALIANVRIFPTSGSYGLIFGGTTAQSLHIHNVDINMSSNAKGLSVTNGAAGAGSNTSIVYVYGLRIFGDAPNGAACVEHSAGRINWLGEVRLWSPTYANAYSITGTAISWQSYGTISIDGSISCSSSGGQSFTRLLMQTNGTTAITHTGTGLFTLGAFGASSLTGTTSAAVAASGPGYVLYARGSTNSVNFLTLFSGAYTYAASDPLSDAFQAKDATLTSMASLTTAADKIPYFTGVDTAATTTLTSFMRTLLDDADAATARATLGLSTAATSAATAFQSSDATLTALAGLTTAADRLPYFTGVDAAAVATLTTYGRSLIDDADAAAARSTLGLGSAATYDAGATANKLVLLDSQGRLPAIDGSLLTNVTSAGGGSSSAYAADVWDYSWTAASGDPTTLGWTTSAGSIAAATVDSVSCYTFTPNHSATSFIYQTFTGTGGDWELRARIRMNAEAASISGDYHFLGIETASPISTNCVLALTTSGLGFVSSGVTVLTFSQLPVSLDERWITVTIRCHSGSAANKSMLRCWVGSLYAGSVQVSSLSGTTSVAGRVRFGQVEGGTNDNMTNSIAYFNFRTGHNAAPPEYTFRGKTFDDA